MNSIIKNFTEKFLSAFFMIFGILTFLSALIVTNLTSYYYDNKAIFLKIYFLMFVLLIILFYILIKRTKRVKTVLFSVLGLGFILRLAVVCVFNVQPLSDFLFYNGCAEIIKAGFTTQSNYASVFPHTLGFAWFISVIYKIFGTNILYPQIFNVICSFITGFLIFKITLKFSSEKAGLMAAFLYTIYPSSILYNELLATEMLFTLLFISIVYITILLEGKMKPVNLIFIGILTLAGNAIRPCGPVILLALSILIFLIFKEKLWKKSASVLIVAVIFFGGNILVFKGLSNINGQPIAKSPLGYSLWIGANTEHMGAWNAEDAAYSGEYMDKISPDEFHKMFLKKGIERYLTNGFYENLKLMTLKFGMLWGSDILVNFYLLNDPDFEYANTVYSLGALGGSFHIIIMLLITIFLISVLKKRKISGMFFIYLTVLGIAAQHILAEVMERYSYSAKIAMLPLAAIGFSALFTKESEFYMFKNLREDINAVLERDPAAKNSLEVFFLSPGIHALLWHRTAHWLYNRKLCFIAKLISQITRFFTGIEIHPGAKIGHGTLIDHGMGVVIGETTVIGDGCTIYQNVTLGGTGKDTGKRHPTIGNNVLIGAGAKVLGPFKVGDNSKVAANAVVLSEVPENSTCVGVPARVVIKDKIKVASTKDWQLDHTHIPDPVSQELCKILVRLNQLEKKGNISE